MGCLHIVDCVHFWGPLFQGCFSFWGHLYFCDPLNLETVFIVLLWCPFDSNLRLLFLKWLFFFYLCWNWSMDQPTNKQTYLFQFGSRLNYKSKWFILWRPKHATHIFAKLSPAQSNSNSVGWAEIALISTFTHPPPGKVPRRQFQYG